MKNTNKLSHRRYLPGTSPSLLMADLQLDDELALPPLAQIPLASHPVIAISKTRGEETTERRRQVKKREALARLAMIQLRVFETIIRNNLGSENNYYATATLRPLSEYHNLQSHPHNHNGSCQLCKLLQTCDDKDS
jgi:hypothetical protein